MVRINITKVGTFINEDDFAPFVKVEFDGEMSLSMESIFDNSLVLNDDLNEVATIIGTEILTNILTK